MIRKKRGERMKYERYRTIDNIKNYQVLLLELETLLKREPNESLSRTIKNLCQKYDVYGMVESSTTEAKYKDTIFYLKGLLSEIQLRSSIKTPEFYGKTMQKIRFYNPEKILVVSSRPETLHCARRSFMGTCLVHPSQETFDVKPTIEIPKLQDLPKTLRLSNFVKEN